MSRLAPFPILLLATGVAAIALLPACDPVGPDGSRPSRGAAPAGTGHDAAEEKGGEHHHAAPRGGVLVELEHEAANLELLLDPSSGKLTAWVLDGCCEKPVRIPQETIGATLTAGGTAFQITLAAQESALTGERKGDTSEFAGQDDRLRGVAKFSGILQSVKVAGRAFQGVKFQYALSPR